MNFNSSKTPVAVPPIKGSFPLDKKGKCRKEFTIYMSCLKSNQQSNEICKPVAKEYLQCRMDNGLMIKENMEKIGYREGSDN